MRIHKNQSNKNNVKYYIQDKKGELSRWYLVSLDVVNEKTKEWGTDSVGVKLYDKVIKVYNNERCTYRVVFSAESQRRWENYKKETMYDVVPNISSLQEQCN